MDLSWSWNLKKNDSASSPWSFKDDEDDVEDEIKSGFETSIGINP